MEMILTGILLGTHFSFFITSVKETSVAASVLLATCHVVYVAILGWVFFGESLTKKAILGTSVALFGILILFGGDLLDNPGNFRGNIFAFISGSIAGRIGLKITTCTGITVMAIGCIISGLTSEYMVMMSGRIIFAVGAGLFFPMLGAIIMQWFYGNELLIVNSINFSGSAVGAAVGLGITLKVYWVRIRMKFSNFSEKADKE